MCMVDSGDDDWVWLSTETHKARKEHRCFECSRTIAPGEIYEVTTAVTEYGLETYKLCPHCLAASSWLKVTCRGFLFGAIAEDLTDHWFESPAYRSLWLGRAIVGFRNRWRRRDGTFMDPLPEWRGEAVPA